MELLFIAANINNSNAGKLKSYSVICSIAIRLRNDLYCVEWGVKLYSLTVR